MSDDVVPYEMMSDRTIALIFADYVYAVSKSDAPFDFQISRDVLIAELERISEWLKEKQVESMNGGRQL